MIEAKKEKNLKKLKDIYGDYRKKYKLTDFEFLNENFEIENIDVYETELLLKAIRKHVTEKLFFILRTLEMFMNAQNAPLFILKMIKSFSESDRELVKDLYKKISQYEIEAFGLEAIYDEKKEAEFIKKIGIEWKDFSEDLNRIYLTMKSNHGRENKRSDGSYVG